MEHQLPKDQYFDPNILNIHPTYDHRTVIHYKDGQIRELDGLLLNRLANETASHSYLPILIQWNDTQTQLTNILNNNTITIDTLLLHSLYQPSAINPNYIIVVNRDNNPIALRPSLDYPCKTCRFYNDHIIKGGCCQIKL